MSKATLSDEQIITALMNHDTVAAAAESLEITPRTVYERMTKKDFQALYQGARADLIRESVMNINKKLNAAVNTIAEIMTNRENTAAVRLQAAAMILNNAAKFADRLQSEEHQASDKTVNHWYDTEI